MKILCSTHSGLLLKVKEKFQKLKDKLSNVCKENNQDGVVNIGHRSEVLLYSHSA